MDARDVIDEALRSYRYPVFFYNGGKESTVLLHMLGDSLPIVYIRSEDEFGEMREFVERTRIDRTFTGSFHAALETLHAEGCDVVIFGARASDPPYVTTHFSSTDDGWPAITRVLPLLTWTYADVWAYIDRHQLPYCPLYERGYTSLGSTRRTFRNWHLFANGEFRHARQLTDGTHERSGRTSMPLPTRIKGLVMHGQKMGREIGYPTANLAYTSGVDDGVYGGMTLLRGKPYLCVVSVGLSTDHDGRTIESHLLNYDGDDFYNEIIEVWLYTFIRPMLTVDSMDQVKHLIERDLQVFWHGM